MSCFQNNSNCCQNRCGCQNCGCGGGYIDYRSTQGIIGPRGPMGPAGPQGPVGPQGPQGIPGTSVAAYADFYALMPTDNTAAVTVGTDVAFPRTAAVGGTGITRATDNSFTLANPGTYLVSFNATPNEAGQLALTLNGAELPYTVTSNGAAGSEIKGTALVTTTAANSVLTVRNPATADTALTLTPPVTTTTPNSAHLLIAQIA